jgi:N-acetylglucosamine-6-phosphate deacetylase
MLEMPFLLKNFELILPNEKNISKNVLIGNGQIIEISDQAHNLDVAESLDLHNLRLFSGFIDIHIHGAVGIDTNVFIGWRGFWQRMG